MTAPFRGCPHSAQDWFRDDLGTLRCTECGEAATFGRRGSDWFVYVGLACVLVALLVSLGSSLYHAGWTDGFRECEAIYQEVPR